MSEYKQYQRKGLSEMRPYIQGEDLTGISVSEPDKNNLHLGGMIARNPKNHDDKWFVAQKYFDDNLEPVSTRHVTPLQSAKDAFIEAFSRAFSGTLVAGGIWFNTPDGEAVKEAWNHLQQSEGRGGKEV